MLHILWQFCTVAIYNLLFFFSCSFLKDEVLLVNGLNQNIKLIQFKRHIDEMPDLLFHYLNEEPFMVCHEGCDELMNVESFRWDE